MTTVAYLFVLACVLNNFSPSLSAGMMGGQGQGCGGDPGLAGSSQCDDQGRCCQGGSGSCWCVTTDCQEIPNTRFPVYGQRIDCNARRNNYNPGGSIMVVPGGCTGSMCNNNNNNYNPNNYNPNQGCNGMNCNNNNQQQQCNNQNEMWMQCLPSCEDSCAGRPADCGMGAAGCTPGCTCLPGYVRQGASSLTPCVPRSQCQGNPNIGNQQQCNNPNEMYMQCMPQCEDSCAGRPADCGMGPSSCVAGCTCRPGYVRQGPSTLAPCVPRSQCQGTGTGNPNMCTGNNCNTGTICNGPGCTGQPSGSCSDPNAMFQSCGSACPETCLGSSSSCSMQCVQGCFCKPGYVKQSNDPNALCLLRSQCITTGCTGNNCNTGNPCTGPGCTGTGTGSCSDPYAEYKTCGSACPESCQGTPSACTMQCVMGCFCRAGYVKQTSAQNSACVRRDQCNTNIPCTGPSCNNVPCTGPSCYVQPPTGNTCQDPNSQYQTCGSACPPSCQQRNSMCGYSCVQGCFCRSGYVKLTSANNAPCVRQDQCNSYVGLRFFRFF